MGVFANENQLYDVFGSLLKELLEDKKAKQQVGEDQA
jgi:hypothetical protein